MAAAGTLQHRAHGYSSLTGQSAARRVCLFVWHDGAARLAPHTRHLLRQIAGCGYALHVALCGVEPGERFEALERSFGEGPSPVAAALHPRPNRGLDFGAWQDLLALGCAEGADEVLLANDSVFGPLTPLRPIVERMRARNLPVWGMVRSEAVTPHLQSWFLVLTRAALEQPAIRRVLAQPFAEMTKAEIVLHGELGLGLAMQASGIAPIGSWSGTRGLAKLLSLNPMHADWRSVLRSGRAPFIKIELLRDNPSGIASARLWRREIPDPRFFDPQWIDAWLADHPSRMTGKKAGFRARLVQALASEDRWTSLRRLLSGS